MAQESLLVSYTNHSRNNFNSTQTISGYREKKRLLHSFSEATITLIPKFNNDIQKKEFTNQSYS